MRSLGLSDRFPGTPDEINSFILCSVVPIIPCYFDTPGMGRGEGASGPRGIAFNLNVAPWASAARLLARSCACE